MINLLIAIGYVIVLAIGVWGTIIVMHHITNPRPKPPPKAIYNPANNEPIGFDLNHKDWDAPQWEAPEFAENAHPQQMLVAGGILTANQIRTMNEQRILTEINSGGLMILPEGIKVQYVNAEAKATEHLSHIKARSYIREGCRSCDDIIYDNYLNEYNNEDNDVVIRSVTSGDVVRMYDKHGYSQAVRHNAIKLESQLKEQLPVIKLTLPQPTATWH